MSLYLLRPLWLGYKNQLHKGEDAATFRRRDRWLLLITAFVMWAIYWCSSVVLHAPWFVTAHTKQVLPDLLLPLIPYFLFLLLLLSAIVAVIGSVYSAERMTLFMVTPVPLWRVYLAKSIEVLFDTTTMLALFLAPAALAFSKTFMLPLHFVLITLLLLIPLAIIAVGIAQIVAVAAVTMTSIFWRRGGILIGALFFLFALFVIRLVGSASERAHRSPNESRILAILGGVQDPSPYWLPTRWATVILQSYFGEFYEAIPSAVVLLLCAMVMSHALGYLVFDSFFLRGRSMISVTLHQVSAAHRKQSDVARYIVRWISERIPTVIACRAIIAKDLTTLIRDRVYGFQALLYLVIILLYLSSFSFVSRSQILVGSKLTVATNATLAVLNIFFLGVVGSSAANRFVFPSVSLEGKSFWLLQAAPLPTYDILRAKMIEWALLLGAGGVFLVSAGGWIAQLPWLLVIVSAFLAGCLLASISGVAVGLGAVFAKFDWESPHQLTTGLGSITVLLAGVGLTIVTSLLFIPVVIAMFGSIMPIYVPMKLRLSIGGGAMVIIIAVQLLTVSWCMRQGKRRLEKLSSI